MGCGCGGSKPRPAIRPRRRRAKPTQKSAPKPKSQIAAKSSARLTPTIKAKRLKVKAVPEKKSIMSKTLSECPVCGSAVKKVQIGNKEMLKCISCAFMRKS